MIVSDEWPNVTVLVNYSRKIEVFFVWYLIKALTKKIPRPKILESLFQKVEVKNVYFAKYRDGNRSLTLVSRKNIVHE